MTPPDDISTANDVKPTRGKPTTLRLSHAQNRSLDELSVQSGLSRSALISLGLNALIDHVKRTGKLLLPQKPTKIRPPHAAR